MFFKRGESYIYLFLICFFCMPLCFSAASVVEMYDGYVYEQTDLLLDETLPVSVVLTPSKAKIILDGDDVFLLDYGAQKKTDFYTISISDYHSDGCDGFEDNKYCKIRSEALTGGEAIARLEITKHVPLIEVSYIVNEDEFYVGSTQEITVTITNKGDVDLFNLDFFDEYPWDLFLGNPTKGYIVDNTFKYSRPNLAIGDSVSITFDVDIRGPSDTTQAGQLTYFDGETVRTLTVTPIRIQTANPLLVSIEYTDLVKGAKVAPTIDEEYDFTLTLTNNIGNSISVQDFELRFPSGFEMENFESDLVESTLTYDGSLREQKEWEGRVSLTDETVSLSYTYFYEGGFYKDEYEIKPTIPPDYDPVKHKKELSYTQTHRGSEKTPLYIPGSKEGFFMLLKNTGDIDLENIEGSLSSSFFEDQKFYFARIRPGENVALVDYSYTVPDASEKRVYTLESSVSYDADNESFAINKSHDITVLPLLEAVSASYKVIDVSEHERVVTGSVTSILPYLTYLDIQLLHSLGPNIISEKRQYTTILTKLEPSETKQLFSYSFFIPDGVSEKIETSYWADDVLSQGSFTVKGKTIGTSSASGLNIKISAPEKLQVGEDDIMKISFVNPSSTVTYENIYLNFIPDPSISADSFDRERITALVPKEGYTKEIPFTVLKGGNHSLGSFSITYFSDEGEPFVFSENEIIISVDTTGDLVSAVNYVEGNVSISEKTGETELVNVFLTNPSSETIQGTFVVGNKSIDFELGAGEVKDYYYNVSHVEGDLMKRNGLGIQTRQFNGELLKQVLTSHDLFTINADAGVIEEEAKSTREADQTDESNIVLVSDEENKYVLDSDSSVLTILIIICLVIVFFIFVAKIYKTNKEKRI